MKSLNLFKPTTNNVKLLGGVVAFFAIVAVGFLLASHHHTPTKKPSARAVNSQVTLSGSDFTNSNPAEIQFDGSTYSLVSTSGTYPADNPYITTTNPIDYSSLTSFTDTLGAGNQGSVEYELSPDNTTWYWWNGSAWAAQTANQANTASDVNANIGTFATQFAPGNLYVRAFFVSNGTQQVEFQSLSMDLTYVLPAPHITSVNPPIGPAAGGTNVTINGTNFTPPTSTTNTWTNEGGTPPPGLYAANLAVIGNYIYLFGGNGSAKIYSAPVSDPTTWTDTGKTIPSTLYGAQLAVIGSQIYLFGGGSPSGLKTIYSAPVSDPTTWTNTGKTLPGSGLRLSSLAIIGSKVYLFGGYNGSGAAKVIYSANTSDPTTWTDTGKTLPAALYGSQLAVIGGKIYLFSGQGAGTVKTIYSANTSDPTTWTDTGKLMPAQVAQSQLFVVGNTIYIFGNEVYSAPLSDPTTWTDTGKTLNGGGALPQLAIIDNKIYAFAGNNITTTRSTPIVSGQPNYYNPPWTTNWPTLPPSADQSNITFAGLPATNINFVSSTQITATTPAHAIGATDVTVTNYDGQSDTASGGFTYAPPPQVTGASPDSGLTTGGDSVTLSGSGFVAGATVKFGSNAASNVTVVNSSTITLTTPANNVGSSSITVTNPDGQAATLSGGFTYMNPPPAPASIAPDHGPTSGGTSVTITGSDFIPPSTSSNTWSTVAGKSTQSTFGYSSTAVIGDKIYRFGGYSDSPTGASNAIYSAPVSDPTTWTDTGKTLPASFGSASFAIVGNTMYLFGGYNGSALNTIYSAPVSDPTTWTDTSKTLPQAERGSQLAIIGNTMYLFGGYNGSALNTIYSANTSDPTTWTDTGQTLPAGISGAQLAVVGSNLYLYGGGAVGSPTKTIYSAPISSPTTWTNTGKTLPGNITYSQLYAIGNTLYLLGGNSNAIYSANTSDPTTWTNTGKTLPASLSGSQALAIDNTLYLFGATGSSAIYSTALMHGSPNVYNPAWTTNWDTIAPGSDQSNVTIGGTPATNVTFVSSTEITATAPAHAAGAADVTVTNYDGQSAPLGGAYTYIPPPAITGVTPASGGIAGGDSVTITGNDFQNGATVSFGITTVSATYIDAHTLTAITPTHNAGLSDVTVTNPDGQSNTLPGSFTFVPPSPTITSITPSKGAMDGGQSITIKGSNLTYTNSVTLGGALATNVTHVDANTLTATTSSHNPGTVDVTVTDDFNQSATLASGYTYYPHGYIFTTDPLNVAATEPGAITVQAVDANGNPVVSTQDITLSLSTDSSSGFFARDLNEDPATRWSYDSVVLPAGQSQVTFYYKDNLQGTPTVTVTDPNGTAVHQQETIGSRYKFLVTGITDPVQAGIPSSVTVQAVDYAGQPQSDYTGTVHFTSSDGAAILPSDFTFTAGMLGLHTFVNGITMRSAGEWCVTATDTSAASITGSQCNITVTPPPSGSISKLKIITPPQSFSVDGNSSAITVQAQDSDGNPVAVSGDTPIYVYSTSGTGQFSTDGVTGWTGGSPYTVTIPAGTTSTNVYYRDSTVGSPTLTMRDDEGTGPDFGWQNDSQTVTVGVGAPTKLGISGPASTSAGEWTPVTIHVQDSEGNDVTSFRDVPVHLTSDSGTTMFSADSAGTNASTSLDATIPSGSATVTVYVSGTLTGQAILTATDTSPPQYTAYDSGTFTLNVAAGQPYKVAFLPVGGPIRVHAPTQMEAYLQDQYGNTTTADTDTDVTFTTSSSGGTFSNSSNGPWTQSVTATIPAGGSTASVYYQDDTVGTPTVSVASEGLQDDAQDLQVIAGLYNGKLRFSTKPNQFVAGQSQAVTVQLMDDYGNPTTATSNVPITINTSASTGEFSSDGTTWTPGFSGTITSGQSSITAQYRDTKAGTITITALQTGAPATQIEYSPTVVAADAVRYAFLSAPQIIAKNATSGAILVQLQDQYGNQAPAASNFTATVTTSSGSGELSLNGTDGWQTGNIGLPFTAGSSQGIVYYQDPTVGTYQLTASGNGLTSAQQSIRVVEGIVAQLNISGPTTMQAGDAVALDVEAQTSDGLATPVADDTTIDLTGDGEFSLTESPWTPITSLTLHAGESDQTVYYRSTTAGTNSLAAQESPSQGWQPGQLDIAVGPTSFYKYAFTAHPATVPVTETSSNFAVTAEDQYGNVVTLGQDTTAYLYTSAGSGTFASDSSGQQTVTSVDIPAGASTAEFYYKDTALGNRTITASDKTPLDNPDQDIVNATAAIDVVGQKASQVNFTTSPRTITAGDMSDAITIQLQKSDGSPAIQDHDVTLNLDNFSGTSALTFYATPDSASTPITTVTVPAGSSTATFYASATKAGNQTVHVYDFNYEDVGLIQASQTLTIKAAAPQSLVFITPEQTIHSNQDSDQMEVELRDAYNNKTAAATDTQIQLSSTCGTGSFSLTAGGSWTPITQVTLPANTSDLYFYYRDTGTGTCALTVSGTNLTSASQNITVIYSAATQLSFTTLPQTIVAGQTSDTITVSAKDVYGNIAPVDTNTRVYFSSTAASGTFSNSSVVIPAGQSSVSVTYQDTAAGSPTLWARDQPGTTDTGLTDASQGITITRGSPTSLAITPGTFMVKAGQLSQLTVHLQNQYGAPYAADGDVTVALSSTDPSGSFKDTNDVNAPDITQIVIPAGSDNATFYYRQTAAGSATITAADNDHALASGTATANISAGSFSGLQFITPPQTLEANQPGTMTVQAVDSLGNAVRFGDVPVRIYLYSTSGAAHFSSQPDFSDDITSLVVPGSATTATFYYKDTTTGTPTVTVSDRTPLDDPDQGITNGVQTETIITGAPAALKLDVGDGQLERGGTIGPLSAILTNAYGYEVKAGADQPVYMSSSSATAQFADAPTGPWQSTENITIPSGQSRASFYYRDDSTLGTATLTASDVSAPPESPDAGLANGQADVTVVAGDFAQLGFTTTPQTITAEHPSSVMTVQALNRYGKPTAPTADTTLFLRSTGANGEFAAGTGSSWGISTIQMLAGQSTVSFYYRDKDDGTPTLTVSNSLSTDPNSNVIKTSQQETIERQVLDHFLVTNISDPQTQGNPSSVVVAAVDADNFVVEWYSGTVTFDASDGNAVLPPSYTFQPATDKGIHTFTNKVAFKSPGEKTVTATDTTNHITGQQTDITVLGNTAGPIAKLAFTAPPPPITPVKNQASDIITLQLEDSSGSPSNAGSGGFPVHLTSESSGGEFALSPTGPWQSVADFTVPEGLNYLNLYYRDSQPGSTQITAADWIGGVDNPSIANATLAVAVQSFGINTTKTIQSRDASGLLVTNSLLFAYDDQGDISGRASFDLKAINEQGGNQQPVNWQLVWRDGLNNPLAQKSFTNTTEVSYQPADVTPHPGDNPYSLNTTATADNGETETDRSTVPVSPWQAQISAPASFRSGSLLKLNVQTLQEGVAADPAVGNVELLDSSLHEVNNATASLANAKKTATGHYEAELLPALTAGNTYYALVRLADASGTVLAEDISAPFIAEPASSGSPGTPQQPTGNANPGTPNNSTTPIGVKPSPPNKKNGTGNGLSNGAVPPAGSSAGGWAAFSHSIKRLLSAPATPVVFSNLLFMVLVGIAVLLLWQAYKEFKQARWLLAVLDKERRTAEDKDNFLALCAHYLRTPITIISSSGELLASTLPLAYAPTVQSLSDIAKSLQTKVEQILKATEQNRDIQAIESPDMHGSTFKIYASPIFWMPIILSIVLTILINLAATAIGEQSVRVVVLAEELIVGLAAVVLLYVAARTLAIRRRRRELLAELLQERARLDRAKNEFASATYDALATDLYHLEKLQQMLPANEKVTQMLVNGTERLQTLLDKLQLLSTIDSTQLQTFSFSLTDSINQALAPLSEQITAKRLTMIRNDAPVQLQQDGKLFGRVIASVLNNAVGFSNSDGKIEIAAAQNTGTVTIAVRDTGPGFAINPAELFEAFKRADDALNFNHDGMGLDLYLDRLIMRHLGGTITAQNRQTGGAEVTITLPVQAGSPPQEAGPSSFIRTLGYKPK
ncbi:MAG TPA: IPT/TIG domain-containing protein [Candidatus Saccharimonadales bacterium]|nr:IPT/TIG domain-containing protein [Candidatus Saccharimonadales bacterium]